MPNTPPNGKYNSTVTGDLSSWSGRFSYTDGAIEYTRANPNQQYTTNNTSQGNAIVFSITDGTDTIKFNGPTYKSVGNKAEYSGNVHQIVDSTDTPDGWTATQTSS